MATWLDAVLYLTDFRPVPLKRYIKDGTQILDHDNQVGPDAGQGSMVQLALTQTKQKLQVSCLPLSSVS